MSVLVAVFFELQYITITRIVLPHYFRTAVSLELATTVVRLLTIPVYLYFYKDVVGRLTSDGSALRQKLFWVGSGLFLLIPILVPPHSLPPSGIASVVFALTSFVVGFREELVYRGVIQNLFERKIGIGSALILSNLLFVVYHVGAVPMTGLAIELFSGGLVFGMIYAASRSLVVASVVHGAYDAMVILGPYVKTNPFPGITLVALECAAAVAFFRWMWRSRKLTW